MPSVTAAQDTAGQYRRGLMISAAVHLLLLLALGSSLILIPQQPISRRAIEAFVVDENSLRQSTAVKPRPPQPAVVQPAPKLVEEPVRQKEPELKEQQQKEDERKAAEAKAEAEKKVQERKAAEAQAAAEKKKAAAEKQERKAAEAKAKAEAEKKEQERKAAEAKAEAERKAAEAKAEMAKQEQARRQAELAAAMAAEEDLFAAQQSGEMDVYIARIQQKVERNWVPPASAQTGLECEVAVKQLPNGDVVDAKTVRCNGDAAVQRSVEAAVLRASPLPLPDNPALFERNLRFIFKPEQ